MITYGISRVFIVRMSCTDPLKKAINTYFKQGVRLVYLFKTTMSHVGFVVIALVGQKLYVRHMFRILCYHYTV